MKIVLLMVSICLFSGCASNASNDKLTYPKGKWIEVNPKGYIPKDAQKYTKDSQKAGVFNEVI